MSYRFVYHGCIDGFSRKIIYLGVAQDNTSRTVFRLFHDASQIDGVPSRVRADRGTENVLVARFMIESRGMDRASFLSGRSVHNQRIERLWSDVNRIVTAPFKRLFNSMKDLGFLDEHDEVDLYSLAFVFLPRIRTSAESFKESWNNHRLRTERHRTPLQLWTNGFLAGLGPQQLPQTVSPEDIINYEGGDDIVTNNNVIVPRTNIQLTIEQTAQLQNLVPDPLAEDDNFGVQHYLLIRNQLRIFLQNNVW